MTQKTYANPAEIRTQLGMQGITGNASDPALLILLEAISQEIDSYYNNPVGFIADKTARALTFANLTPGHLDLPYFISVTAVMSGDHGDLILEVPVGIEVPIGDITEYRGSWKRPNYFKIPYTGLILPGSTAEAYLVTARWGYAEVVPPLIKQIVIALTIRAFKHGESGWSDVLASFDLGQMIYARENSDLRLMLKSGHRPFGDPVIA